MQRGPAVWVVLCTASLAGCALTTYLPTEPRPAQGPGVQVDVIAIRGLTDETKLSIRSQGPTLIGPISWSTGAGAACSATGTMPVGRPRGEDLVRLPETFETVAAADVVFVELGPKSALAQRGLFLDVKVATPTAEGCLRVPLTAAAGETLWRADGASWSLSAGLRVDAPWSRLAETGTRVSATFRTLVWVGPVRPFFGVSVGAAGCRGADCPEVASGGDDEQTHGIFGHVGAEAGLERSFPLGRWSLSLALGGSIADFKLGAPEGYPGDRHVGVAGPFTSLTFFFPRDVVPGFVPENHGGGHGPELFVARQIAFGRGPTETAWVTGLGWRIEGSM
jgi:hypothetical protein